MSDDLGLFADDSGEPPRRGRKQVREERERFRRRRRRRTVTALASLLVLVLVGVGVLYGASQILHIGGYDDYDGPGTGQVIAEVKSGESISSIGQKLAKQDVVASTKAFTKAAANSKQISGVQPGYYLMKSRMSGEAAVQQMISPEAKTGRLEVRGGMRLDDQAAPDGKRTPGILSMMATASCSGGGKPECVTPEQMREAATQTDLGTLGVPQWAIGPASKAEPRHRLEGLIMPGVYDVKPGEKPEELLRQIVTSSGAKLQAAGLPQAAQSTGHSPYELLTTASLVQSEAIQKDFARVARVIDNRVAQNVRLQFDSTINYPLDKPTLLTRSEDRNLPGPYNTYENFGLPPTPISSAGSEAVTAAEKPTPGQWLYFVKCYPDGTSCFAENQQQHQQYIREAQQRGAF